MDFTDNPRGTPHTEAAAHTLATLGCVPRLRRQIGIHAHFARNRGELRQPSILSWHMLYVASLLVPNMNSAGIHIGFSFAFQNNKTVRS